MTQKSSKIPNWCNIYKNDNNTWFSAVLLCMYWRIIHGLYNILRRVWSPLAQQKQQNSWKPCIILEFLHALLEVDYPQLSTLKKSTAVLLLQYVMRKYIAMVRKHLKMQKTLNEIFRRCNTDHNDFLQCLDQHFIDDTRVPLTLTCESMVEKFCKMFRVFG